MSDTLSPCLSASTDVRALRDALPDLTHVFSGFPLNSKSSSRTSMRGDLLYRAALRNPAEVFRVYRQFAHIADLKPEDADRSETYRMDVLVLLLRWQDLPPFRFCAFSKPWGTNPGCGMRAGYVIAAGELHDDDWSALHFSDAPWLVCDQHGCQNRAAQKEGYAGALWVAIPAHIRSLIEYVNQEFDNDDVRMHIKEDPAFRRQLYAEQERFGDQIVRLYDVQGTPYGTAYEDLWRARKFFKIVAPPKNT